AAWPAGHGALCALHPTPHPGRPESIFGSISCDSPRRVAVLVNRGYRPFLWPIFPGLLGSGGDSGPCRGAHAEQGGGGWSAPVAVPETEHVGGVLALGGRVRCCCWCCAAFLRLEAFDVDQVGAEAGAPDYCIDRALVSGGPLEAGGREAGEHRGGGE